MIINKKLILKRELSVLYLIKTGTSDFYKVSAPFQTYGDTSPLIYSNYYCYFINKMIETNESLNHSICLISY